MRSHPPCAPSVLVVDDDPDVRDCTADALDPAAYNILRNLEFPWPVAETVYQHHEHLEGSGYPRGLHGLEIRPEARILAVADVLETIASYRPHRPARGSMPPWRRSRATGAPCTIQTSLGPFWGSPSRADSKTALRRLDTRHPDRLAYLHPSPS